MPDESLIWGFCWKRIWTDSRPVYCYCCIVSASALCRAHDTIVFCQYVFNPLRNTVDSRWEAVNWIRIGCRRST